MSDERHKCPECFRCYDAPTSQCPCCNVTLVALVPANEERADAIAGIIGRHVRAQTNANISNGGVEVTGIKEAARAVLTALTR